MAPSCKELDAKLFDPLDFSYIHGYPHDFNYKLWKKHALKFYGNKKVASEFAELFIRFIAEFNIIHEDVMLKMFSLSYQEEVREWFCSLSPRKVSLFSYFITIFQENWMVDEDEIRGLDDA
jgi:hypothetical protein